MSPQRKFYKDYLKSKTWKAKRAQAIFRDGGQCQAVRGNRKCGSRYRLEVHHKTYERFGRERLNDLVCLCEDCHKAVHAAQKQRAA
jgi:5-methylcytosine-specific restriction endonuclease McrA